MPFRFGSACPRTNTIYTEYNYTGNAFTSNYERKDKTKTKKRTNEHVSAAYIRYRFFFTDEAALRMTFFKGPNSLTEMLRQAKYPDQLEHL